MSPATARNMGSSPVVSCSFVTCRLRERPASTVDAMGRKSGASSIPPRSALATSERMSLAPFTEMSGRSSSNRRASEVAVWARSTSSSDV